MLIFNNTEIAFSNKTNHELKKAYWLFKTIENPKIVLLGNKLLNFALKIRLPIKWIIKPTVFEHFCGGETINECNKTIENLSKNNIGTILDYSAEGISNELNFENVTNEILEVIQKSKTTEFIPFAVFKVTGIANIDLLEKLNNNTLLTDNEMVEYSRIINRIDNICKAATISDLPVFIDAEESWIQNSIDNLTEDMMRKYNKSKAIVFNTLQMYRHDRLAYLERIITIAKEQNFKIGLKLVRGAYMEKEREKAEKQGYPSPIQADKNSTDKDYDKAIEICIQNADIISLCAGTHNEKSNAYLAELIEKQYFNKDDKRFYFAQLLGMSDHISYNLAHEGFNVAKYVPYGPVKSVMPYLIRRAQENTSIAGQTGRELSLIQSELKRRKIAKI